MANFRIGQGYDVHAYTAGRGIVVGGVNIVCDKAVVAHSDGDVLLHALCDALLGGLGRGDIGRRFANDDPAHQNRDSREFVRDIEHLMRADGYCLGNADMTIIAQTPKMAPHIDEMCILIANDLVCHRDRINVKATTTEKLGFIGRQQGIAATAVVMLEAL